MSFPSALPSLSTTIPPGRSPASAPSPLSLAIAVQPHHLWHQFLWLNQLRDSLLTSHDTGLAESLLRGVKELLTEFVALVERGSTEVGSFTSIQQRYFVLMPLEAEHLSHQLGGIQNSGILGSSEISLLVAFLQRFLPSFRTQFRTEFRDGAIRHIFFRAAPMAMPDSQSPEEYFVDSGSTDIEPIADTQLSALAAAFYSINPQRLYSSPHGRALNTLRLLRSAGLSFPEPDTDARLSSQNLGEWEGKSFSIVKELYPRAWKAWLSGMDPRLPGGGENYQDISIRAEEFIRNTILSNPYSSAIITHEAVLASLLGSQLGLERPQWARLCLPHLAPIEVLVSPRFGFFVDIDPQIEANFFQNFTGPRPLEFD